ncbi:MAG: FAD-dependent oxidoreductase [Actinomycetota bacterium]|nr:FAD-dependent oxidoreductase [Actinomycetota bacterium]
MNDQPRIVIIGAGPCGLGCGRELEELGHKNWRLVERAPHAGGLASSVTDPQGFTWDHGGHVVFSHFGEFDRLLDEVMGDDVYRHERSSYIRFDDRWVPYPFQNNLRYLPNEVAYECMLGLIEAGGGDPTTDFATWMRATFGDGITKHFMEPYNFKVWATPADRMQSMWIGERVAVIDYKRALKGLISQEDDVAWGPNNTFVFPAMGGTGEIYRRLALKLEEHISYNRHLVSVDAGTKTLRFEDGSEEDYDILISTMPIDLLVGVVQNAPDLLREAAKDLEHNGVYMVGIGYEAPFKDDMSWSYYPQDTTPFYRSTNFAKYSPSNVPDSDTARYSAYMTETSYSGYKLTSREGLEEDVEAGLRAAGVVEGRPEVASMHLEDIPYAYPVPTLKRDAALATIHPWLMERGIYSRGRFGSWRYEMGNMDHAVKMGVDIARRIVKDAPEELWSLPDE